MGWLLGPLLWYLGWLLGCCYEVARACWVVAMVDARVPEVFAMQLLIVTNHYCMIL